jgi:fatty-acyl-CoA synthase
MFGVSNPSNVDTRGCIGLLLYHIGASTYSFRPLFEPNTTLVFPSFKCEIEPMMAAIGKYSCEWLVTYPKAWSTLLDHPLRPKYDLSSLKLLLVGGSNSSVSLIQKTKSTVPTISNMNDIWGMTEFMAGMGGSLSLSQFNVENYVKRIGKLGSMSEAKVVDLKTGQMVPLNENGELLVRGFAVTKGYWKDEEKTREAIDSNGWFRTGDVMSMDNEGVFTYRNRIKDVIKSKNNKGLFIKIIKEDVLFFFKAIYLK